MTACDSIDIRRVVSGAACEAYARSPRSEELGSRDATRIRLEYEDPLLGEVVCGFGRANYIFTIGNETSKYLCMLANTGIDLIKVATTEGPVRSALTGTGHGRRSCSESFLSKRQQWWECTLGFRAVAMHLQDHHCRLSP